MMGILTSSPQGRKQSLIKWSALLAIPLIWAIVPLSVWAQEVATYRDFPMIGSRVAIWVIAQQHLLFGGFVLSVPIFAVIAEFIGHITKDRRYENLAREVMKLLMLCFSTTALFGGFLLFALNMLYPKFFAYLVEIFYPTMYLYVALFFAEAITLYLYYYFWDAMANWKMLHILLGVLLNIVGTLIMLVSNSWAAFMMSPKGIDMETGALVNLWEAVNNYLWWPVNIHRLLGNLAFGGAVVAAYAAFRFLNSTTPEEKAHYDWMGYTGNFIAIFALIPLPFAGYWLGRELYAFSAQMGTTLMGGAFSWLFIMQAALIGVLFIGTNYYLYMGLERIPGGSRYYRFVIFVEVILFVCLSIWMTPHSLVASLAEARSMGAIYHPILGVFGVMSAKNTVVNLMILTTFFSFLMYRRANKVATVPWATIGKAAQGLLFLAAAANVIFFGVYGYYVPANIRIGFSVYQVSSVLTCLISVFVIDVFLFRNAREMGQIRWGEMPVRSQYVLFLICLTFVLTMSLMGFARSGIRLDYHVVELGIMQDKSPQAFTPTLGFAATMMAVNTFTFFCLVSFLFWVGNQVAKPKTTGEKVGVPQASRELKGGLAPEPLKSNPIKTRIREGG